MDRRLAGDFESLVALCASAALFYVAGSTPLFLIGLVLFAVLAWMRIDLALLAVVVFLPYYEHPKTVFGHPFPPSEWLLGVVVVVATGMIAAWLLGVSHAEQAVNGQPDGEATTTWELPSDLATGYGGWRHQFRPDLPRFDQLLRSSFVIPGSIFFVAAVISTFASAQRSLAARNLLEVVIEPMVLFALILLFVPAKGDAARNRSLLLVGIALLMTGLGPSVIALGQLISHQHLIAVPGAGYKRIGGSYSSADNLGLLLDRTVPFALALALVPAGFFTALWTRRSVSAAHPAASQTAHSASTIDTVVSLGATVCFVLMGLALVLTFVLGAWLGTAIAAVAMLLIRFRPGWWVVGAVVVVLIAAVALGTGKAHVVTAGNRLDIWRSAIHMIHDHPIVGIGPDNFQHYYAPHSGVSPQARQLSGQCNPGLGYMEPAANREPCLSQPHNELFDFWLSTGVLGVIGFLGLQFVFWRVLWRTRARLADWPVVFGAGGSMLASLLHGLVDNSYFLIDLSALMWMLFAVASLCSYDDNLTGASLRAIVAS